MILLQLKVLSMARASLAAVTRLALAGAALAVLGACSFGGGGQPLSPGLSAPMNTPGAQLSRVEAIFLINDYRRSQDAADLRGDSVLDSTAQTLATNYAKSGTPPTLPPGIAVLRTSAGYLTFAETFSSWRATPADASALADPTSKRIGLAVAYEPNSANGTYWVMLLAP